MKKIILALLLLPSTVTAQDTTALDQSVAQRVAKDALMIRDLLVENDAMKLQLQVAQKQALDDRHRIEGLDAMIDATVAERDEARSSKGSTTAAK